MPGLSLCVCLQVIADEHGIDPTGAEQQHLQELSRDWSLCGACCKAKVAEDPAGWGPARAFTGTA